MPKILTIEDDPGTGQEIVAELEQHGFEVELVADGREGLIRAVSGDFDAITLDRMLPSLDGLAIITVMRGAGVETPVLMISALSDVDERVRGLRAGGPASLSSAGRVPEARVSCPAIPWRVWTANSCFECTVSPPRNMPETLVSPWGNSLPIPSGTGCACSRPVPSSYWSPSHVQ